jgi:BolA protein
MHLEEGEIMGKVADAIRAKLTAALQPTYLEIVDESSLHAGHAGARGGGESHFRIAAESAAFSGMTRVARHRMVMGLLSEEFSAGVHALQISAAAPGEACRQIRHAGESG